MILDVTSSASSDGPPLTGSSISGTAADGSTVVQFHGQAWSRPYPPIYRAGVIHLHDRPYAEFGNKGWFSSITILIG